MSSRKHRHNSVPKPGGARRSSKQCVVLLSHTYIFSHVVAPHYYFSMPSLAGLACWWFWLLVGQGVSA